MRKIILILLVFAFCFSSKAKYPGYSPVEDFVKFKMDFSVATGKIVSIKSDFMQEKNLSMISEKIISKGKFWFKKESKVRMEYTQPYQYIMVLNKDKVFIKDGQKENTVSTKSNKLFQQINKIMIDCMQGTAFNNTDFKTRAFENKNTALVELIPVTKGLKGLFKTINIVIDKKDYSLMSINMEELSGDNTILHFTNKELNANISDALFIIK